NLHWSLEGGRRIARIGMLPTHDSFHFNNPTGLVVTDGEVEEFRVGGEGFHSPDVLRVVQRKGALFGVAQPPAGCLSDLVDPAEWGIGAQAVSVDCPKVAIRHLEHN